MLTSFEQLTPGNLVPRPSVVEGEVEGWLSHDQILQYSWKIFLAFSQVLNFCNKFSKYIGKFGHVTTSLCQGPCPTHASLQRGSGKVVPQVSGHMNDDWLMNDD